MFFSIGNIFSLKSVKVSSYRRKIGYLCR